jgi:hypothetical protein
MDASPSKQPNYITDRGCTVGDDSPGRTSGRVKTMKPSHINPGTKETLGAHLEQDRLILGARRLSAVIAALRQQVSGRRAEAHASGWNIHRAIAEFEAEVASIDARLRDLASGVTPARSPRDRPGDWTTTRAFGIGRAVPSAVTGHCGDAHPMDQARARVQRASSLVRAGGEVPGGPAAGWLASTSATPIRVRCRISTPGSLLQVVQRDNAESDEFGGRNALQSSGAGSEADYGESERIRVHELQPEE